MKKIFGFMSLMMLTFALQATAGQIDVNSIDCSIGESGNGRVDRVRVSANDETGEVQLKGWKKGVLTDDTYLDSSDYELFDQKDLAKDPQFKEIAQEIAGRINVDLSKVQTVVKFTVSGTNFFLLKFVSKRSELGSAMTIFGTTYQCQKLAN